MCGPHRRSARGDLSALNKVLEDAVYSQQRNTTAPTLLTRTYRVITEIRQERREYLTLVGSACTEYLDTPCIIWLPVAVPSVCLPAAVPELALPNALYYSVDCGPYGAA